MDHNQEEYCMELPPGFRFHPTDEEIITHYLTQKVLNSSFSARAIGEVDLNKSEPWELPKKAKMGEKEYYFFCQRDRKYPTGMRTNRATESGYWKATGKDKEIFKAKNCLVGMKKTLVFYKGRAPKGEKTNWVMHEYRLEGKFSYNQLPRTAKDEWVVCRIFHKSTGVKRGPILDLPRMGSFGDGLFNYYSSLPPLMDPPYNFNTTTIKPNSIDGDEDDGGDFSYGTVTAAQMAPARTSDANPHHQFIPYNNSTTMATNSFINSSSQYNSTTPLQIPPPNMSSSSHLFSYQGSHQNNLINHPSIPNSSSFDDPDDQAILKALAMTNNNDISYGLMKKHCKVEPYNNSQPMVSHSQDTGVSTDANTEISSVASKHDLDHHHQGPSPSGSLDYLWSNY